MVVNINETELNFILRILKEESEKTDINSGRKRVCQVIYSKLKPVEVTNELKPMKCNYISGFSSNINERLAEIRRLKPDKYIEIDLQTNVSMVSYANELGTFRINIYLTKMTVSTQYKGERQKHYKRVDIEMMQRIFENYI